jgi:hypothetical protein
MKRLHFVPLALLLLLAAPRSAAAGPIFVGSVVDGVGGSGPDIIFASIVVDDAAVTFTMRFAPGTLVQATTRSVFHIDADQNSATGAPWNGLGVEFLATQGSFGDTSNAHLTWFGGGPAVLLGSVAVSFSSNQVEYAFARSLFGAEDGLLNFIAAVQVTETLGQSVPIHDFAPDFDPSGGGGIASTAVVPEPATLGLLAGGLSALSAYRRRSRRRFPRA